MAKRKLNNHLKELLLIQQSSTGSNIKAGALEENDKAGFEKRFSQTFG